MQLKFPLHLSRKVCIFGNYSIKINFSGNMIETIKPQTHLMLLELKLLLKRKKRIKELKEKGAHLMLLKKKGLFRN